MTKRILMGLLGLLAGVSLAWIAIPVVLLRPFVSQTAADLATAYALRARAVPVTWVLLAVGAVASAFLWRRTSWKGRIPAGLLMVLLAGCVWFAQQNHFEWMFHPLPRVAFVDAASADHVTPEDLVLGIALGEEARAYPVRELAYHHLVNDVVGGRPIVATY